ncbi:hypothetical protein HPB48_017851 [Haemaphysalis longicornis]|uniref:Cytochrome P450 n=1 Tax=Haemaphysalis longicornis TaxID=44386 RepID=A0A9J6FRQ1_HAELO|nr:hypothetical protein HPB48_017851 [Haemaphysalis longicornis]
MKAPGFQVTILDPVLYSQGEEWRRIRTMVQPCTIRPRTIQAYAEAMGRIADDALSLIDASRDCNGDVHDCHAIMKRWALESVMFVSLDKRLGLLEEPLRPDSEAARFMHGALSVFECLDKLGTRFPYYRYFPTPTIRNFECSGDYLVPRMFSIVKEAAEATRDKEGQNCTILSHLHNVDRVEFKEIFTFLHDFLGGGTETTLMKTEPFVAGRLEENFTRASEFLPERWLRRSDEDQSEGGNGGSSEAWTLHPFASLPFSIGPRMCIGRRIAEMELCTLVAKVHELPDRSHGHLSF